MESECQCKHILIITSNPYVCDNCGKNLPIHVLQALQVDYAEMEKKLLKVIKQFEESRQQLKELEVEVFEKSYEEHPYIPPYINSPTPYRFVFCPVFHKPILNRKHCFKHRRFRKNRTIRKH